MDDEHIISLAGLAKMVGMSRVSLYYHIRQGRLKVFKVDGSRQNFVHLGEAARWLHEERELHARDWRSGSRGAVAYFQRLEKEMLDAADRGDL